MFNKANDATSHVRLFVYGTLKRGFPRAELLAGAVFEGPASTRDGYALYDLGAYPALVAEARGVVAGEVYGVPVEYLAVLDEYEGCPELYRREAIVLADGSRAEAYLMGASAVKGCSRIEAGVWLRAGSSATF